MPDYRADWRPPEPSASSAEIKARFYYEFARESEVFSGLIEKPTYEAACYLSRVHFPYVTMAGQIPGINLRATSWNQLNPKQREAVISALSPRHDAAFRAFEDH